MENPADPATTAAIATEGGTGKKRRRWPWILLGLFLLFGLAVFFLVPPLAGPVIQMLIKDAGAEQGYTVTVASCTFGWQAGLRLEGVSARENIPHGIRAEVRSVVVAPRWRSLLGGVVGFGRVRIDRPRIILDPARQPPPRKKPDPTKTPPTRESEKSTADRGGRFNVDVPLVVRDGELEVLPIEDRPGFRLERLQVDGRFLGPEGHVTGRVQGDLVTGNQRKPLQMSGDIRLGDHQVQPSGSALFDVGGVDLAAVAPLWTRPGMPVVERGTLRAKGELRAEGALLLLTAHMNLDDLKVVRGGEASQTFEEPAVRLDLKASFEPGTRTVRLQEMALHGAPLSVTATGTVQEVGTTRSGKMELSIEGQLERLQAFLPGTAKLAGAMKGALVADYRNDQARLEGGLDFQGLRVTLPPEDAASGTKPRVFDVPEARLDLNAALDTRTRIVTFHEVALRKGPLDLKITGTAQNEPTRSARIQLATSGELQRLQPFLPGGIQLAGAMTGAFTLDYQNARARLTGGADVQQLCAVLPPEEPAPGQVPVPPPARTAGTPPTAREIRDAHVRLDVDVTATETPDGGYGASGHVKVAGETLRADAELTSSALPALEVKGTLGGETARLLAQAGVKLPVGWNGVGAFASRYQATLNRTGDGQTDYHASVWVDQLAFARPGVTVDKLTVEAKVTRAQVQVAELRANLNGGTLVVRGELDRSAKGGGFRVDVDMQNVGVTQALAPLLQYVVPLFHIPEGVNGRIGGTISGKFALQGPYPLAVDPELATLKGSGELLVQKGFVEGSPLVGQILTGLGQDRSYAFHELATRFHVEDRAVVHDSFTARGREMAWGFKGQTRFDTTIDYRLDPGPLLERLYRRKEKSGKMRGWERLLKEALKGLENVPVSLGGTLDSPSLKLMELSKLAPKGKDPVNQLLEGIFGGKKKK